jgi:hypothetical protein
MSRESELTIGFALVIAMGCGVSNAAAQTDNTNRGRTVQCIRLSPNFIPWIERQLMLNMKLA